MEDPETLQSQGPDALTVRRALNDYLREHVRENVADQGRQRTCVDHLIAFGGDDKLSSVDIPWTRAYARARREGKIGGGKRRENKVGTDATIRRELHVLVAAANHEKRWKRMTGEITVELPAEEQRGAHEVPYFERDVLAAIFAAAEAQVRACLHQLDEDLGGPDEAAAQAAYDYALELEHWIKLTYYTGSRGMAVARLHAEQIRLGNRTINLQKPGQRTTKKRRPIVPIFDEILPICVQRVAKHPTGPIFRTVKFYRPFMRLCRSLDLPEPHHPHMLRHSRATHLLQDGKKLYPVAGLLGDTLKTTETIYGHHSPEELMRDLQ
jgi:integrase